ncbi:Dyp-type peroxidase [Cryptosporangium sp. NPDC051539]|uniref:Dyp-type peroxidase n=1 Tax=Cryptosporangium sp. NPDC051539 TaxID=3363962 RepID=UPI0037A2E2E6
MVKPVEPQPVLTPLTEAALFLVLVIRDGGEDTVRDVVPDIAGIGRSVGFRSPEGDLKVVAGFGSDAWDRLFGGPRPAELHPFAALDGPRHHAPSTPGDLLLHVRARRMDLCFEFATQLMKRLKDAVEVVDETAGFRYFDQRDLMGFVDGTENPTGAAALDAAAIGDEDPDFTGGSYVIVQKYLHDLDSWNALPVEAQEHVIGRTKLEDIELPDDVKPPDSHVALNTIEDEDGNELQIVRDNMPFGSIAAGDFGTYFIGYSKTPSITEQMLRNMFLGRPPGVTDRILEFSSAVTGSLFFVPSADFLDDPPGPPAPGAPVEAETPTDDGSLRIGSLKRSTAP